MSMYRVFPAPAHPAPKWQMLSALVLSATLSACSVLPKSTPVTVYQLPSGLAEMPTHQPSAQPALGVSLRVTRPLASPLLAGQRLLVEAETHQLSYYKGSQWSDSPPALLRQRLLDALHQEARLTQLSHEERIVQADYELNSELRAFQSIHRQGQAHVLLVLEVSLVKTATQRMVAHQRFSQLQAASSPQLGDVVQAFGQVSDDVAQQVSAWTTAQLQQNKP